MSGATATVDEKERRKKLMKKWDEEYLGDISAINKQDVMDTDPVKLIRSRFSNSLIYGTFLVNPWYKFATAFIIIVNVVMLASFSIPVSPAARKLLTVIDIITSIIFICDTLMEWYHTFWRFWTDIWKVLDFLTILISLIGYSLDYEIGSTGMSVLKVIKALRIFRFLHLIVDWEDRLGPIFKGIINVMALNIFGLGCVIVVFAAIGLSLFGDTMPEMFGTMDQSLFTIFQLWTLETWSKFTVGIQPKMVISGTIFIFFYAFIVSTIGCGLIVGVIAEGMYSDRKAKRKAERALKKREKVAKSKRIMERPHQEKLRITPLCNEVIINPTPEHLVYVYGLCKRMQKTTSELGEIASALKS